MGNTRAEEFETDMMVITTDDHQYESTRKSVSIDSEYTCYKKSFLEQYWLLIVVVMVIIVVGISVAGMKKG